MAKQAERRETTRNAIIDAAQGLFGANGFNATTIDEIANLARVAKGGLYHHFPNKETLFETVFERASEELVKRVSMAARRSADPLDAISVGAAAYLHICSQDPIGRILLHDGPAVLGWQRWREIDSKYFGSQIPAALGAALKNGLIKDQPIEPLARLLLGALSEAAIICSQSSSTELAIRLHLDAMERILSGLRC